MHSAAIPYPVGAALPEMPVGRLLALYRTAPLGVRLYLRLRLTNFPKREMWPVFMGLSGTVISCGAGYGLFETLTALANPAVRFLASDIDARRISIADRMTEGVPNIDFSTLNLLRESPARQADGFLLMDVLHHLPPVVQVQLLRRAASLLRSGGRLVIKDCGVRPRWKRWFNRLHDAVLVPFERTWHRSEEEWTAVLRDAGLQAAATRLDRGWPYAHILIVGIKP